MHGVEVAISLPVMGMGKGATGHEAMGGNIGRQTGLNGEPGVCLIAYLPEFAPYLGDFCHNSSSSTLSNELPAAGRVG